MQLELEELERRLVPANVKVDTLADDPNVPIPAHTTLRDAIKGAGGNTTITFAPGLNGTIQLQASLPALPNNLTINGGNAIAVAGSGPNAPNTYNVFTVNSGATVEIDNLTISNGYASSGGGIYNSGNLTLNHDNVVNNSTPSGGLGGGIYNNGTLNLKSTDVNNNQATSQGQQLGLGGGIYNASAGTVRISNSSEINSNKAANGGGIFNSRGTLIIGGGTVDYNTVSGGGGGVDNAFGRMILTGVTIYENFGGAGGGIYTAGGNVNISDCYIFSNGATTGNGGGVLMAGGTALIWGGTIQGNLANNGNGGGVYVMSGSLTLNGGVLIGSGNSAINGGGMYLAGGLTTFSSCTVSGNKATGKGVGVAYQNANFYRILFNGLTDTDDPNGQPVQA